MVSPDIGRNPSGPGQTRRHDSGPGTRQDNRARARYLAQYKLPEFSRVGLGSQQLSGIQGNRYEY